MRILSIKAELDRIVFALDVPNGTEIIVRERSATVGTKPGRLLSEMARCAQNGSLSIERFDDGHDRLYSAFYLFVDDEPVNGPAFVTDFDAGVSQNTEPYPQPAIKKAVAASVEDLRELGIKQATFNINLPAIMTLNPDGAIAYAHDGHTYYFIKERIEAIDRHMIAVHAQGVLVTMILLNSPRLFKSTGEKQLLDTVIHPAYDWEEKSAFISAFDMRTEDGQRFYRAFCSFLAERYTRPDHAYGQVGGAIISNEVDSQYIWGNAGEMAMEAYAHEYVRALRLCWLAGRRHAAHFRVYATFTHHWTQRHDATQPQRFYKGRDLLGAIAECAQREGDFDWHIAFHPYPEDLKYADFWHDRTADFSYSTRRITFRNMEVLEAYLSQDRFLYRGQPRRIIFSEQGFNSLDGPLKEWSELNGEAGYVLAYLKARNMKTVDMFFHHAYLDSPHEFGLNLGIRRYDPTKPNCVGQKKPIYDSVREMDTEAEPARIAKARAVIGDALFDYLLNPPNVTGDRDTSMDNDFG